MTNTVERPAPRLVTLPCNGAWQACYPAFQYKDNTGDFVEAVAA